MAKTYCLPRTLATAFRTAFTSGNLDVNQLANMDSLPRRQVFETIVGPEHAEEVNTLFESKLVLKNVKIGLQNWAKQLTDVTPVVKKDIVDRIADMDKILNPANPQKFYADLAKQKLGYSVTSTEAQDIFNRAQNVQNLEQQWTSNPTSRTDRLAYGRAKIDFMEALQKMKPDSRTMTQKLASAAYQTWNWSKPILTLGHLSAPGVQDFGSVSTLAHWQGIPKMIRWFADGNNYKDWQAEVITDPLYEEAQKAGIALVDIPNAERTLIDDQIDAKLLQSLNQRLKDVSGGKIPNLFEASSRGFSGYQSFVRFTNFKKQYYAMEAAGYDVRAGSEDLRSIAKEINNFSGYGEMGKIEPAAPLLNMILFSARKTAATINMYNPARYLNPSMNWAARNYAMKRLLGQVAFTVSITQLANQMGYGVDYNPISQDFLKINVDGQKFDVTGGNAIYQRLLARINPWNDSMITSEGKELEFGEGYRPITKMDEAIRYFRGKLAPMATTLANALYGTDPVGRPFSITQEARNQLLPIVAGQFLDYHNNNPDNAAAIFPSIASVFGYAMESPRPTKFRMFDEWNPTKTTGLNVWGEPSSPFFPAPRNAVDKELERLHMPANMPYPTINGHKLTDDQYKDYIVKNGQKAKDLLNNLISRPSWMKIPDTQKERIIKGIMRGAKTAAQEQVIGSSIRTDNNLVRKITQGNK